MWRKFSTEVKQLRTNLIEEIAKEAMRLSDEDYDKFIEYLQKQAAQDQQKEIEKKHKKSNLRKQNEQFLRSND